jgi:hypothetical protein
MDDGARCTCLGRTETFQLPFFSGAASPIFPRKTVKDAAGRVYSVLGPPCTVTLPGHIGIGMTFLSCRVPLILRFGECDRGDGAIEMRGFSPPGHRRRYALEWGLS